MERDLRDISGNCSICSLFRSLIRQASASTTLHAPPEISTFPARRTSGGLLEGYPEIRAMASIHVPWTFNPPSLPSTTLSGPPPTVHGIGAELCAVS